ncbi:hypothetical protein F4780DRAFT_404536 [Xylariomycetidae sp. FL0641]|nr:hypothetical protein F4780DRAFT_404536 [Xylariomycetidae sp. FL0641]
MSQNRIDDIYAPNWLPFFSPEGNLVEGVSLHVDCQICGVKELAIVQPPDDDHEEYVVLPCGHAFGFACVNLWLNGPNGHPSCPACRKPVRHGCSHGVLRALKPADGFNIHREIPDIAGAAESLPRQCARCDTIASIQQRLSAQALSSPIISRGSQRPDDIGHSTNVRSAALPASEEDMSRPRPGTQPTSLRELPQISPAPTTASSSPAANDTPNSASRPGTNQSVYRIDRTMRSPAMLRRPPTPPPPSLRSLLREYVLHIYCYECRQYHRLRRPYDHSAGFSPSYCPHCRGYHRVCKLEGHEDREDLWVLGLVEIPGPEPIHGDHECGWAYRNRFRRNVSG